ncbi:MAG: DJ-1/PfpI family protein [Firmicutes bacterium]|nr:DJ-1/PfpI family protein [Bacillota bacterium]
MEKKVAVLVCPGFEEGETLTIVDIIRRAFITCHTFGAQKYVSGSHEIEMMCDEIISEAITDYDMVVLPGGYGGADYMKTNSLVQKILKEMNEKGKFVCAMCAAPIALEEAGILEGRDFTAYKGYDQKIKAGNFKYDIVVQDGNIITSRGPATAYVFAYALVEALGGDAQAVKSRMVYYNAFKKEGE